SGQHSSVAVRVYNDSKIVNLAERAATDFRDSGWTVTDVGVYSESQGRIAVTTVYFRPGTAEDAEAHELGKQFGLRVEERFPGLRDATPGIIVIVTKEYDPESRGPRGPGRTTPRHTIRTPAGSFPAETAAARTTPIWSAIPSKFV